jgi:DnaJ-class molecular chaperone
MKNTKSDANEKNIRFYEQQRKLFQGKDAYQVMGLHWNADQRDVHAAFRRLALHWHPDRHNGISRSRAEAEKEFKRIEFAYSLIKTRDKREAYDKLVDGMHLLKMTAAHRGGIKISNDNAFNIRKTARATLNTLSDIFWPIRDQNEVKKNKDIPL